MKPEYQLFGVLLCVIGGAVMGWNSKRIWWSAFGMLMAQAGVIFIFGVKF